MIDQYLDSLNIYICLYFKPPVDHRSKLRKSAKSSWALTYLYTASNVLYRDGLTWFPHQRSTNSLDGDGATLI